MPCVKCAPLEYSTSKGTPYLNRNLCVTYSNPAPFVRNRFACLLITLRSASLSASDPALPPWATHARSSLDMSDFTVPQRFYFGAGTHTAAVLLDRFAASFSASEWQSIRV